MGASEAGRCTGTQTRRRHTSPSTRSPGSWLRERRGGQRASVHDSKTGRGLRACRRKGEASSGCSRSKSMWLHYPPPSQGSGTRARIPARARAHETRPPTIPLTMRITAYKVAVERSGPMRSGSMGPGDVTSHHIGLMSALMTRSSASLLWPDGRERERDA